MKNSVNALWIEGRRLQPLAIIAASVISLAVAGCQTETSQSGKRSSLATSNLATSNISAKGVPVALESIEGVPSEMTTSVKSAIITQASVHAMDVVSPGQSARFRVRGYVTAYANDYGGTALTFVWDVFDPSQSRAQRVTASITTPGGEGTDVWSRVDENQLEQVSRKGIDELAAFLAKSGSGVPKNAAPVTAPTQPVLAFTQ